MRPATGLAANGVASAPEPAARHTSRTTRPLHHVSRKPLFIPFFHTFSKSDVSVRSPKKGIKGVCSTHDPWSRKSDSDDARLDVGLETLHLRCAQGSRHLCHPVPPVGHVVFGIWGYVDRSVCACMCGSVCLQVRANRNLSCHLHRMEGHTMTYLRMSFSAKEHYMSGSFAEIDLHIKAHKGCVYNQRLICGK